MRFRYMGLPVSEWFVKKPTSFVFLEQLRRQKAISLMLNLKDIVSPSPTLIRRNCFSGVKVELSSEKKSETKHTVPEMFKATSVASQANSSSRM
jgi:hypothetical protein